MTYRQLRLTSFAGGFTRVLQFSTERSIEQDWTDANKTMRGESKGMWWRIILVLLVLVGLIGFGLVYFDPIWSMVQNFWGLDDALRKKILDLSKIIDQFFGFIAILAGLFVFIFWFIKTTGYQVWDMSGNVFEWISSLDPNSNPFIRGESWNVNPNYLRCAACFRFHPFIRDSNVGFRVVFSLAAES